MSVDRYLNAASFTRTRAKQTHEWCATDTAENYRPVTKYGRNAYLPGDFTYRFNSQGFRGDDFDAPSEIPILFVGCSITEGTGLPLEETWPHKLLEKIRTQTGNVVPLWNTALAGAGVDSSADQLYRLNLSMPVKPKFVFGLLPPFFRRTLFWKGNSWSFNINSTYDQVLSKDVKQFLIDEDFYRHQAFRSLSLIDTITSLWDAELVLSAWDGEDHGAAAKFLSECLPHRACFPLSCRPEEHRPIARDGMHWGAGAHTAIAEDFWSRVAHLFPA